MQFAPSRSLTLRDAAVLAAAFVLCCAAIAADLFAPFELALMDQRFANGHRVASGNLIIVEIDAKSLQTLSTWPWPRSRHGELIDKLTAAGAQRIAFDIDFSSASTPDQDHALAQAIVRAGGRIILPAFGQRETTSNENTRTAASEPLPAFRDNALIGHVNIWPLGSLARTIRAGVFFGETYRPAMAALVSDQVVQTLDERYIDYSIDPLTIPRLSFSDVVRGQFDPNLVKGRTLIVGGTAIELGDRLPVPVHGVLPGVTVQALAAESMTQGRSIVRTSALVSIAITLSALCLLLSPVMRGWARATMFGVFFVGFSVIVTDYIQDHWAVSVDLGPAFAMILTGIIWAAGADLMDRAKKLTAERARSAARQALIARIVEHSSDGILAVNSSGNIVICNAQAATLFASDIGAMQGQPVEAFLPISADPYAHLDNASDTTPLMFEHVITAEHSAEPTVVEAVVNRSLTESDAAEPIFVVTLRDITARKRMEAAERRAAEERLLTERAKSLFIANMSHELRTPLNAIIGFSEILESETLGDLGNKKYKEYSSIILKSGHHLLDMVNNVLEISRLESGGIKVERRPFDLASMVESCFNFIRNSRDFEGQKLTFDGATVETIRTDVRLLKQILANLLSNAIKFSRPGHKNCAKVFAIRTGRNSLRLTVADDGVGMTQETVAHVTDLFFQGDGTFTRKHEGRGLGLYLVKKHVELIGGRLSFESTPGQGTQVHIDLPDCVMDDALLIASA